ncbi:MAG: peptidoglycan-binding domain-containing protein [Microcoleus sp.]|uniref:peptidoglycan-binding domain-containing protein n=1 Tax=Microcoleus sp. TaxID=44472 RepID=UPI003C7251FC
MNSISILLQEGSQGTEVTKLQEALKDLNFDPGIIDGIFGRKTKQAVINFQKSQQLVPDGIVGDKTWAKLNAANNPRFNFQVVNVQEFISFEGITATNPKAVAAQLFRRLEDEEGRNYEEISITYSREGTSVILYTRIGLADDSARALRHRVELKRDQNQWEIIWVGRQFQCQPGRGHQEWSGIVCS